MRPWIRPTAMLLSAVLAQAAPLAAAAPQLTVVVVVDQMRADYLQRYFKEYAGGFARLARRGAVFAQARHGHVPTETSPGHASLLTGCFPAQHGIVGNHFLDRKSGKIVYAVDDPDHGVSPANLMCPSLGDVLKAAFPRSKAVSVSGKDRAAILMGGRKPDLALWYDASAGRFMSSSYYARVPDWVLNWNARLNIAAGERAAITLTPRLDALTLDLARQAVEEENLGRRQVPDLLTVSLSATDLIGHQKGPDSPEIHDQLLALDREFKRFLDYLDLRIGPGNYVFALSSDHGVLPVPESAAGKAMGAVRVSQKGFIARLESALKKRFGPPSASGKQWVTAVYQPNVYLNMPMAKAMRVDPELIRAEAARVLKENSAVAHVFLPQDLGKSEVSGPFAPTFKRSFYADRSGDVLILLKEGILLTDAVAGTSHGSPYDYDARVPLVLMGAGIKPGRYGGDVLAEDLAPTLARVLGLRLQARAPGRVLVEALRGKPESRQAASSGRALMEAQ